MPAVLTLICDALKGVIVIAIAYLFGKWFGLDDNGKALLAKSTEGYIRIKYTVNNSKGDSATAERVVKVEETK